MTRSHICTLVHTLRSAYRNRNSRTFAPAAEANRGQVRPSKKQDVGKGFIPLRQKKADDHESHPYENVGKGLVPFRGSDDHSSSLSRFGLSLTVEDLRAEGEGHPYIKENKLETKRREATPACYPSAIDCAQALTGGSPAAQANGGQVCASAKRYKLQNRLPNRKRMRLREFDYSSPFTYFITLCTKSKAEYFRDHELCTDIINCLLREKERCRFSIYAYCLMPKHLHLLLSPNESGKSVSEFVGAFKSLTTKIAWNKGLKGKLWQSSFYDHVLRKDEDLRQTAEYILNNPVRKGLAPHWNEYPYTGLLDEIP